MRTLIRFIRFVITFTAIVLTFSIVAIGAVYFYFARDLPNIRSFEDYRPPVVSEVFAMDGTKMGEFWIQRRLLVKYDDIPKIVINAFIAAEDSRFFEHKGVDVRGIGRAFYENLKAGHVVQGGSTITQQITRSILLSREKSYARKIREAILATRIDRSLSKREILEIYLNEIFLGNRAYGVRAAAENYFHKNLSELTLAEAAMIAGLTQAPSTDNPVTSPERAKARQLYVLKRMEETGIITKDEMDKAAAEPLTIYVAGLDKDFNYKYAPYFTEEVRRILLEKYGDKVVYEGGLKIYTTADITMNKAAERAVRHGLQALDHRRRGYHGPVNRLTDDQIPQFLEEVHNKALTESNSYAIHIPAKKEDKAGTTPLNNDNFYPAVVTGFSEDGNDIIVRVGYNTGVIKKDGYRWAMGWIRGKAANSFAKGDVIMIQPTESEGSYLLVQIPESQGALFSMEPKTGFVKAISGGFDFKYSEFNRATQALRQPGSSFKPIIYAAALDKGYKYTTPVSDSPVSYKIGNEVWTPKNYGGKYAGNTTFESNLVYSRNIPTVKIAQSIGTHYIVAFARKLGLTNHFYKYLSMSLGANSVYLQEMVNAFCAYANYGFMPKRVYITKIEYANGKILEEYTPPPEPMPVGLAYLHAKNTNPAQGELNTELYEANKEWIKKDGLQLSDEELRILYGKAIPDGYVMTPQTAYLMVKLMEEVVKRGTGARVRALEKPVAGKTGTTNEETDAWFIGFVPDLAAGVWVGNDLKTTLGRGEQGGRTAAPIFLEYMQEVTRDWPAKEFTPPEGFPIEQIASLTGGSAIYSTGLKRLEPTWFGISREIKDRAVDFFEDDLGF